MLVWAEYALSLLLATRPLIPDLLRVIPNCPAPAAKRGTIIRQSYGDSLVTCRSQHALSFPAKVQENE